MNILHVMGMDSTKYGGIERFNVELTKQLKTQNHNIIFIYECYPDNKQFADDIISNGGKIYILNSKKIFSFSRQLIGIIRSNKIDIVHAHFTKALFYSIPLAWLLGVRKLYFTIHSTMCPLSEIKLHTKVWYKMAVGIAKVVSVSRQIESVCRKNWKNIQIKTLYLGVEPIVGDKFVARQKIGLNQDETIILTISNFNKVKGLDTLCCAIEQIKEDLISHRCKVVIVGQPETDLIELKKIIDELKIQDIIVQVGISNEVAAYITAADIYVQASRHEGLPLSLMEACSAHLPIIASNVGGIPEIVKDDKNGFLIDAENHVQLAEKLLLFIQNRDNIREIMGKKNREIFPTFQVETNVRHLLDYYEI